MKKSLTTRSIVIGIVFVFANVYWVTAGNEIWGTVQLTIASLFFNAVFSLFILSLLNLLLHRFSPKRALSQAEMLVIYVMTVMTSTLSGHTMMSFLMGLVIDLEIKQAIIISNEIRTREAAIIRFLN